MTDTPNVVLCNECKKWFDSSLAACPSCEHERPGANAALATARLNGALSRQVGYANAEARAESQFKQARNAGGAAGDMIASRPLTGMPPGYSSLVNSIKQNLKDTGFGQ